MYMVQMSYVPLVISYKQFEYYLFLFISTPFAKNITNRFSSNVYFSRLNILMNGQ